MLFLGPYFFLSFYLLFRLLSCNLSFFHGAINYIFNIISLHNTIELTFLQINFIMISRHQFCFPFCYLTINILQAVKTFHLERFDIIKLIFCVNHFGHLNIIRTFDSLSLRRQRSIQDLMTVFL